MSHNDTSKDDDGTVESNVETSIEESSVQESSDEKTERQRQQWSLVKQQVPFVLTLNIVSHPEQLPSLTELNYVNPRYTETTIKEHLQELIDYGIVEVRTLPEETRTSDLPWKFYGLTNDGYELLEERKMLRGEQTLQDMFQQLEKTSLIKKHVQAPRPE